MIRRSAFSLLVFAIGALSLSAAVLADSPSGPTSGPFRASSIYGDIDGSGTITAVDALAILTHVVGKPLPEGWTVDPHADVNCDDTTTALDALIVLSYVVARDVSQFCVGKSIAASMVVDPDSSFVRVTDTVRVLATLRDGDGAVVTGLTVTWSAADTAVASVEASGLVTGKSTGSTWVTGVVGQLRDSAHISVAVTQTARQTVTITLPTGVSSTGLKVLTLNDSTPVTDLASTPVNLDPTLISTVGILDASDNPILLGSALYPESGANIAINVTSTAVTLVMMHPFVSAVLYFDPTGDKGYAQTIAGLTETAALVALIEQKLPGTPGILTGMDAAMQGALNDAAMAFLDGLPSLPTKSGPRPVVKFEPDDTTQSGIKIQQARFDSAGTRYSRLSLTNERRRYLNVFVEDSAQNRFGVPSRYFVAPANDLIAFSPLKDSQQQSILDVTSFDAEPADGLVQIHVYGPGLVGITEFDEWSRVAPSMIATAMTQFLAPVIAETLSVPGQCAMAMMNNMFAATLADNAMMATVEQQVAAGDHGKAVLEILSSLISKLGDEGVFLNFLVQCGFSAGDAAKLVVKLGSYAVPVLGQVRLAASVLSVGVVAIPTLYDISRSTLKESWALENRIDLALDFTADARRATLRAKCTNSGGATVPCGTVVWDYGDGKGDTLRADTTVHYYDTSGSYKATATVTDTDGAMATDTMRLRVAENLAGVMAFAGCRQPCANDPAQIYFYDMRADTVKQLTDYSFNDPRLFNYELAISPDGNFIFYHSKGGVDGEGRDHPGEHYMIFVPDGEVYPIDIPGHTGYQTSTRSAPNFAEDGTLVGLRTTRKIVNGWNISTHSLVKWTSSGAESLLADTWTLSKSQPVCIGYDDMTLFNDGTLVTNRVTTTDMGQSPPYTVIELKACEFNVGSSTVTKAVDVPSIPPHLWNGLYRRAGGGYTVHHVPHRPRVLDASGSQVREITSMGGWYFDSHYHYHEDVILIAEGVDGMTVAEADGSDKQTRLADYRVVSVAGQLYPARN